MEKNLHIVSFDIPFPPSYGGVIDVFCKIRALHKQGVKIHLHCYEYHRKPARELEHFCASVNYYRRKKGIRFAFGRLPYIASTRSSEKLLQNLLKDDYPVLFEGIHTCFFLDDKRMENRFKLVRAHNVEHEYYLHLANVEKSFFRKKYFESEAHKLKKYEAVFGKAKQVIAISSEDFKHFSSRYENVSLIPAFHPHDVVDIADGKGDFAFYHGNLSIAENNAAALYLVKDVFGGLKGIPLVLAGNNPSEELIREAKKYSNVELKAGISTAELHGLLQKAQINILPTFQPTGMKLKMLAALFAGRHCIVNSPMITDSSLRHLCTVADSAEEMKSEIARLMQVPFQKSEIEKRRQILSKNFSNSENARKLAALL